MTDKDLMMKMEEFDDVYNKIVSSNLSLSEMTVSINDLREKVKKEIFLSSEFVRLPYGEEAFQHLWDNLNVEDSFVDYAKEMLCWTKTVAQIINIVNSFKTVQQM